MVKIYKCKRCGWEFVSRLEKRPVRCGKCKSPYWDREKRKSGLGYVDKVREELHRATGSIDMGAPEQCFPPKGPEDEVDCEGTIAERVVVEDEYTQSDAKDMKLRAGEKGVYMLFLKMHGRQPATRAEFDLFKETMLVK